MKKVFQAVGIAFKLWISTALLFAVCLYSGFLNGLSESVITDFLLVFGVTAAGSIPAFFVLILLIFLINRSTACWQHKTYLLLLAEFVIALTYTAAVWLLLGTGIYLNGMHQGFSPVFIFFIGLFASAVVSTFLILKQIAGFYSFRQTRNALYPEIFSSLFSNTLKHNTTMETFNHEVPQPQTQSNRFLIKGLITGGLILLMLIPTIFINNLIIERQSRQQEVVQEVSSKWASAQTLAGPYLVVPYIENGINADGKAVIIKKQLVLLANNLDVAGVLFPENRPRSIYKVLLYRSRLDVKGMFKTTWPADINTSNVDLANAKLCFGLSDFKGIEEEIYINFNGQKLLPTPGLPFSETNKNGLSVPVTLNFDSLKNGITFDLRVKLKGSEQLHFMPLSANSKFAITSSWPSPSFDGDVLPNERVVNEKGFSAKWSFNQANLPFGTVVQSDVFNKSNLSFGVSMVQPADQYNKTMRSVKYAILFIGLTFALFFIVEIMQRKPFHPVQYVLVGLALVIFYTLLLSISEYMLFDHAYLIAAAATILLITLYAQSHFKSWAAASVFAAVLSCLYGFIFTLIRLEDTALIVGSIGLFLVLAIVMYASRKLNWYGNTLPVETLA